MSRFPLRLLAAAVIAAGWTVSAQAVPANESKSVDVVLCLDVSGSMQGLVDSAKIKLWDIVNELAKVKPTPNLRVGLYSYGHTTYDAKAGWVRKEIDLTTDLDEVYKKLNALTINGGEEYVARVCRDALVQQKWSEDKQALRLIFVCGNEPVDQDKEVQLKDVAQLAKDKGVIINTIYCNWGRPAEEDGWKQFAGEAGGKYAMIEHNQKVVQINTPYDKDLLTLNGKLNDTYVAYGARGEAKKDNQAAQDKNAAAAGGSVAASRVATKGGALYRNSDWCLVCRAMEQKDFDITKIPENELPNEMKKMTMDERKAFIAKKIAERKTIQAEIAETSAKRSKYLADEMKKTASSAEKQLDTALRTMIRDQAATKGIDIPK